MKLENQRGSITVEATISLTVFMFLIITILSLINVCRAQAKIAIAIDSTAKEISQYSYFYGLTGLHERHRALAGFADETADNINNIVSSTNDLYNSIQSIAETGMSTDINDTDSVLASWEAIKEEALNGESSVANLEQMVGDICSDPKNMILGIGAIFATEGINEITSRYIAAPIAKVLCKKHFTDAQFDDPNAYLKSLGVVDGLDGIDFTNSKLFPDGKNTIEIVAVYKVKVIQLFPIENEFVFYQTAETKGWLLGEESE